MTMNFIDLENKIVTQCLGNLQDYLGGKKIAHQRLGGPGEADIVLTLPTRPPLKLVGECKANIVTRTQAHHAVLQARAHGGKDRRIIILTKWIPPAVAEVLRKEGVFYIDTVGNAYLWNPPGLGIDIQGKKPEERPGPEPGRIVEPGGLKVCHLLLTQPGFLERPLREIAEHGGVALGTVHTVVRELMAARYLLPGKGRERRFGDVKGLIDAFVRGYAMKLRPACLVGRFRHKLADPGAVLAAIQDRLADDRAGLWAVTGGMAARELTRHLEPAAVAVFADEKAEKRLKEEPMLPDRNGNVTLLRLFAPTAIQKAKPAALPLATPLLIYAELLNEGGPRELETAQMILEKYILPGVGA